MEGSTGKYGRKRMQASYLEEPTRCPICNGIELIWEGKRKQWIAPYVEGAALCDCSDNLTKAQNRCTEGCRSSV